MGGFQGAALSGWGPLGGVPKTSGFQPYLRTKVRILSGILKFSEVPFLLKS